MMEIGTKVKPAHRGWQYLKMEGTCVFDDVDRLGAKILLMI